MTEIVQKMWFMSNKFALFCSSCSILDNCNDCYTEDRLCHGSCGSNVESKFADNVIEFITDVELEHDCKTQCLDNSNCVYYTHYGKENDHNSDLCILLSDIKGVIFWDC